MKYSFFIFLLFLTLISCKKETNTDITLDIDNASIGFNFFDEFRQNQIDSVEVFFPEINKKHVLSSGKTITNLPAKDIKAIISKKGFVTQEIIYELSKSKTINDNIILVYDSFILEMPTDTLYAGHRGKQFSFSVRRNNVFEIEKPNWVKIDTLFTGSHSIKINIEVEENAENNHRFGFITFKNKDSKIKTPVYQLRKNRIESVFIEWHDQSSFEVNLIDSIDKISSITTSNSYCYPNIENTTLQSNKSITFKSGCNFITQGITYNLTVQNLGGLDTLSFRFQGYDEKLDMNQYNENGFWNWKILGSNSTNNLYYTNDAGREIGCIDLNTFKVTSRSKFNFPTRHIAYNSFNKQYYVTSTNNILRKVNPTSGQILEEIFLSPIPDDHPESPKVIPEEVQFNKNGLGLMVNIGNNISGSNVFSINTADKNKITRLNYFGSENYYSSVALLYNELDFSIRQYSRLFLWKTSNNTFESYYDTYVFTPFNNLAIYENRFLNTVTHQIYGDPIYGHIYAFDKVNNLIYSHTQDQQRSQWITYYDLYGKLLNKIPTTSIDMKIDNTGKYLIFWVSSKNSIYRIRTDYFKKKMELKNWSENL